MAPLIEVRSANERGASNRRSPKTLAEFGVADRGPVDHDPLRADARPFDIGQCDAAGAARPYGVEHMPIGNRGGITFAL